MGSLMQGFNYVAQEQQYVSQRSSLKSRNKSRISAYSSSNGSKQPRKRKNALTKLGGSKQNVGEGDDAEFLLLKQDEGHKRVLSTNYMPFRDLESQGREDPNKSMKIDDTSGMSPLAGPASKTLEAEKILS